MYFITKRILIYPNNVQQTLLKKLMLEYVEFHNILHYIFVYQKKQGNDLFDYFEMITAKLRRAIVSGNYNRSYTGSKSIDDVIIEKLTNAKFKDINEYSIDKKIKDFNLSLVQARDQDKKDPRQKDPYLSIQNIHWDAFKVKIVNGRIMFKDLLSKNIEDFQLNSFKLAEKDYFSKKEYIYNPSICYNGRYFYVCLSSKHEDRFVEHVKYEIGIDFGIICTTLSDGTQIPSINRNKRVKTLEKRKERLKEGLRLKYHKFGEKPSNNYLKHYQEYIGTLEKIRNIRKAHVNKIVSIVFSKHPSKIVLEDLDINNMMADKSFKTQIEKETFAQLRDTILTKAKKKGIRVVFADRYFPSSKTCSRCGHVKKKLSITDRVYKCNWCFLRIDRDLNAAINLQNYKNYKKK